MYAELGAEKINNKEKLNRKKLHVHNSHYDPSKLTHLRGVILTRRHRNIFVLRCLWNYVSFKCLIYKYKIFIY